MTSAQRELIEYLLNDPEATCVMAAAHFGVLLQTVHGRINRAAKAGYIMKKKEMRPMPVNMNGRLVTQKVNRIIIQPTEKYST